MFLRFARSFSQFPKKPVSSIPATTFHKLKDGKLIQEQASDLFVGRSIVFGLPGAFTPTCSSTHLPGYEANFDKFKQAGIDNIFCVSVNDPFVMSAWAKNLEIKNVTLLADGNCDFTENIGMDCDKSGIGFGKRSWRYSMVLDGLKVEKVFPEPVQEGDPFEVSDADTMLQYLTK